MLKATITIEMKYTPYGGVDISLLERQITNSLHRIQMDNLFSYADFGMCILHTDINLEDGSPAEEKEKGVETSGNQQILERAVDAGEKIADALASIANLYASKR